MAKNKQIEAAVKSALSQLVQDKFSEDVNLSKLKAWMCKLYRNKIITQFCRQLAEPLAKNYDRNQLNSEVLVNIGELEVINRLANKISEAANRVLGSWEFGDPVELGEGVEIPLADIEGSIECFKSRYPVATRAPMIAEDKRMQSEEDRTIRRLDSLSRLFTLLQGDSVCTAVAHVNGRLVVSCNVSQAGGQPIILRQLFARYHLLKALIKKQKSRPGRIESLYQDQKKLSAYLDEMILSEMPKDRLKDSETAESLLKRLGCSVPYDKMGVALSKFVHAICEDDDVFTKEEKDVWLGEDSRIEVLLPTLDESHRQLHIISYPADNFVGTLIEVLPLEHLPEDLALKHIHAEQLITRRVFRLAANDTYDEKNPLKFGVCKLCCGTCYKALSDFPTAVRGTHTIKYDYVARLLGDSVSAVTPGRPKQAAKTNAVHSNPRTHFHRRLARADFLEEDNQLYQKYQSSLASYLSSRAKTYYWLDMAEALLAKLVEGLGWLLGCELSYETSLQQRSHYINNELLPGLKSFDGVYVTTLNLSINKGLTLFKPRVDARDNSLKHWLTQLQDEPELKSVSATIDFG